MLWTYDNSSGTTKRFGCAWTTQGGGLGNWHIQAPIVDYITGAEIVGATSMEGSVFDDGKLYVAYSSAPGVIGVLEGVDNDLTNKVDFKVLKDLSPLHAPLSHSLRAADFASLDPLLPGRQNTYTAQIAVDPSNLNRFYFTYEDIKAAGSADVDVYAHSVDRRGLYWYIGPGGALPGLVPAVPPETYPDHYDQFLPTLTVDDLGRVHVLYYDEQFFPGQLDTIDPKLARYDVVYGVSCDGGQTYTKVEFHPSTTGDTAYLDWSKEDETYFEFNVRDYIGIDWSVNDTLEARFIWGGITGTRETDEPTLPPKNHSIIARPILVYQ